VVPDSIHTSRSSRQPLQCELLPSNHWWAAGSLRWGLRSVQICISLPFPCRLSSGTCLSWASEGQPTVPASPPPPWVLPVCRCIPGHLVTMYSNSCPSLIQFDTIHVTALCVLHRVIYIFNHQSWPLMCTHVQPMYTKLILIFITTMSSYIIRQHTSFAGDY